MNGWELEALLLLQSWTAGRWAAGMRGPEVGVDVYFGSADPPPGLQWEDAFTRPS